MPEITDVDPALVDLLHEAGARWGALGVALAAAQLTDPKVVVGKLTGQFEEDVAPKPENEVDETDPEMVRLIRQLKDAVRAELFGQGFGDNQQAPGSGWADAELRALLAKPAAATQWVEEHEMELVDSYEVFTKRQRRRAEALLLARQSLIGVGNSRGAVEPFDLVYVAAYLENGYLLDSPDPAMAQAVEELPEDPPEPKDLRETAATIDPQDEEAMSVVQQIARLGLEPGDACPGEPAHLVRSHLPGGFSYGVPLDHHHG